MRGDREDVGWVTLEFERHREVLLIATSVAAPRLSRLRSASRPTFFLSRL